MLIRQETPGDYNAVYELVKQAFSTTTYSDGTEQDYLNGIRNKGCFIPELSLVAVENGTVVGQIVLYKMPDNNGDGDYFCVQVSFPPFNFGHEKRELAFQKN